MDKNSTRLSELNSTTAGSKFLPNYGRRPASWDNAASRWETFMRPLRQPFTFPGNCPLARAECIHTIEIPTPLPKENMRQDFQELPEQHIPIQERNWWKRRICEEEMRRWDDIAGICRGLLIRSRLDRVKCRRKSRKNRCRRKKRGDNTLQHRVRQWIRSTTVTTRKGWEIRVDDIVLQKGAGKNKNKIKSESKEVWKYQMQVVNKVICSGVAVHAPY